MSGNFLKCFFCAALVSVISVGCSTANHFADRTVLPDDGRHHEAMERAQETIAQLFPAQYRATQRAIITAGGKQFTCDGLLTVSPADGHHLALVSSFGVVTDLRVKADAPPELLKVTPLFREDWSRDFVARDLRRLFVPPVKLQPGGRLADGRLVLASGPDAAGVMAEYCFSADGARWQELDLVRAGKIVYHAEVKRYGKFPNVPVAMPVEFEVTAESYRLELRIAALKTKVQP